MDKLRETIADVRPLDTKAMAAAQSRCPVLQNRWEVWEF